MTEFDSNAYKKRLVKIWNEVALKYHTDWASKDIGPFKSTSRLIKIAGIKKGERVLDLACGTGAVIKKISSKINSHGRIIGIDIAPGPIKIARLWNKRKNVKFVVSDVEKMHFDEEFDSVTCQYGFMFFPNSQMVLKKIRKFLKSDGKVTIAVHGSKKDTPYFSCISNVVTKFIPDFIPPGTPTVHRFGTKNILKKEFLKAGFKEIRVYEFNFQYKAGTFEEYWDDYFTNLSTSLKNKFKSLNPNQITMMKKMIKNNTKKFIKKGKIIFPWKVLILTAVNPKKLSD